MVGINLPVLAVLLLPFLIPMFSDSPYPESVALGLFPVAFLVAWLIWSYLAPRWRLWALQHVNDATGPMVQHAAAEWRLLWPTGSFLERTELRPSGYPLLALRAELRNVLAQALLTIQRAEADGLGSDIYTRLLAYLNAGRIAVEIGRDANASWMGSGDGGPASLPTVVRPVGRTRLRRPLTSGVSLLPLPLRIASSISSHRRKQPCALLQRPWLPTGGDRRLFA